MIFERLVAEYGFDGHYQRVKMYVAGARPRIAGELAETDENRLVGLRACQVACVSRSWWMVRGRG